MFARYGRIGGQTARLNHLFRLSSAAAKPAVTDNVLTADKSEVKTVGQFYHNMLYRSRQSRLLPIRDLKTLFGMCTEKEHLKYAVLGVELFQEKGQDFSEEISALFVKTCIALEDPMAAVKLFLKLNRRIAAWQSASSVKRLVESAYATAGAGASGESDADAVPLTTSMVNMLGVLQYKGVVIVPETLQTVAADAAKADDPVLNKRITAVVRKAYAAAGQAEAGEELLKQHPLLLTNQATVTKGMIDSKTGRKGGASAGDKEAAAEATA